MEYSDVSGVLGQFLGSEQGKTFEKHQGDISKAAGSKEGKAVLSSISGDKMKKAVESGDYELIINEVNKALSTPEGKSFYENIRKIIGE